MSLLVHLAYVSLMSEMNRLKWVINLKSLTRMWEVEVFFFFNFTCHVLGDIYHLEVSSVFSNLNTVNGQLNEKKFVTQQFQWFLQHIYLTATQYRLACTARSALAIEERTMHEQCWANSALEMTPLRLYCGKLTAAVPDRHMGFSMAFQVAQRTPFHSLLQGLNSQQHWTQPVDYILQCMTHLSQQITNPILLLTKATRSFCCCQLVS